MGKPVQTYGGQYHYMDLPAPHDFSFHDALAYLGRSDQDILHRIENDVLYKLLKIKNTNLLLRISQQKQNLRIEFLNQKPNADELNSLTAMIRDTFDLERDLDPFYEIAEKDPILAPLVEKYRGLRLVGIPDLFETITWAIIGQQINLTFAYTLKKRLIETYAEHLTLDGETYWLFPSAARLSTVTVEELTDLQFTRRKAEYVIGVAKLMADGELAKENLLKETPETIHHQLISLRGIGDWTAHYAMMRCFLISSAFPISDVGLHNALKARLNLDQKPSIKEIEYLAQNWAGWEAYATFYLWRSLHD